MQPTFLPWIGYFALIDRVDEFIIFDHVQFEKRSWQQRNKIKTPSGELWLSVPVSSKGKQGQAIKEAEILYEGDKNPLEKIVRSLELNYKKTPFFNEYAEDIFNFFNSKPQFIADLNLDIIKWVCGILEITTPLIKSSTMELSGTKDMLLVDVCKNRKAEHYISPPGSKVYLEGSDAFENENIMLSYHDYNHPQYNQMHGDFVPFMCILDLLFNEGNNSVSIIREGLNQT